MGKDEDVAAAGTGPGPGGGGHPRETDIEGATGGGTKGGAIATGGSASRTGGGARTSPGTTETTGGTGHHGEVTTTEGEATGKETSVLATVNTVTGSLPLLLLLLPATPRGGGAPASGRSGRTTPLPRASPGVPESLPKTRPASWGSPAPASGTVSSGRFTASSLPSYASPSWWWRPSSSCSSCATWQ